MGKAMITAEFEGVALTPEELKRFDIFADVQEALLKKFPGTVRRREFEPGEVVCRQGEGGTTAFYIVEGRCRIFIARPEEERRRGRGGLIARIGALFGQPRLAASPKHDPDKLVPIDATVDLVYGRLASTLGPGDVFGEMSCLNYAPRSATVVAETPCVMLEILRNMYETLMRSKTFKSRMDEIYRQRALDNHLKNVWLFEGLPRDTIEKLKQSAELVSFDAGTTIFQEGDQADGMYLIRRGQVRVSKTFPGGERRLAYLTRGDCFGEIALLRKGVRTATCVADDHPVIEGSAKRPPSRVELVKIKTDDFNAIVAAFPDVRARLEILAERRLTEQVEARVMITPTVHSRRVEELGLIQGQNLMIIDLEKCTRCDQCAQACVAAHDDGLSRLIREGPRFDKYLVPASCRMCLDPVCMIGCPVGSIRKAKDLNIVIEDWCVGCGKCARQCPYNSIQMHPLERIRKSDSESTRTLAESGEVIEVTDRAVVCDQCTDLPTGPACVYACPHDAAQRVNARDFLGAHRHPAPHPSSIRETSMRA